MILTGEGRLESDIWPEIANQDKNTENIMRRVQSKEAYYTQRINEIKICALSASGKKARYMSQLTS